MLDDCFELFEETVDYKSMNEHECNAPRMDGNIAETADEQFKDSYIGSTEFRRLCTTNPYCRYWVDCSELNVLYSGNTRLVFMANKNRFLFQLVSKRYFIKLVTLLDKRTSGQKGIQANT